MVLKCNFSVKAGKMNTPRLFGNHIHTFKLSKDDMRIVGLNIDVYFVDIAQIFKIL